ncbi:hypothetical protein [Microbacterium rhizophilus]|uniref:hypothetical protein n=1 Tax=Microbacterium rhizophilus TaxID=3138934 RepID=UPI0031E8F0BE
MSVVHVCPADHKHGGKTTCYTHHKCRCVPCTKANTDRQRLSRQLVAAGIPGRLDPEPIADHVRHLMEFGYSFEQIARAAGVNEATPYRVVHGKLKFVFGDIGRAILGVHPRLQDLDPLTLVPSRGARRRLQALGARGWALEAIARTTGPSRGRLSKILCSQSHITVATHQRIAGMYEQLWNADPPADTRWDRRSELRTRRRADALGWLPPLAWDDIDTDPEPPAAEDATELGADIDVIAIDLAVEGARVELTTVERHVAVAELTARGRSANEIALLLGVTSKTIERDRAALAHDHSDGMEVAA